MNRTIPVSTDVFAAIWAQRLDGEESEDAILRRLLGCTPASQVPANGNVANSGTGFTDTRNGITFPNGFRIFRTYKRKEYSAIADNGTWRRADTNQSYDSLNQLNAAIAAGNENVWNGSWKFKDSDGTIKSISALRG